MSMSMIDTGEGAGTLTTRADLDWWLALAPTLTWTWAKTYADTAPHSYVVRGGALDDEDFIRAVRVIRTFGEPGKFYSRTNVYLVDRESGHRWWTMGAPVEETIIINQAPTDQLYGEQNAPSTRVPEGPPLAKSVRVYDALATEYDARYTSEECRREERAILSVITEAMGPVAPRTLDIGCGTGLLMDYKVTHPSFYTGVDPSQGMLNEFVRKHPEVTNLLAGTWEDRRHDLRRPFDLVVSLFGSASYLRAESIESILQYCSGLAILMHYREGYWPDYYGDEPPEGIDASREAAGRLGGRQFNLNNFVVTVVGE